MLCDPKILDLIRSLGGTLVIRPDSGEPREVLSKVLFILQENLPDGSVTVNKKGYLVLQNYLRVIWGDGINRKSMVTILRRITELGWSASNLAMGSGGGLLMDCNRDTQKFAFKCSFARVNGESVDAIMMARSRRFPSPKGCRRIPIASWSPSSIRVRSRITRPSTKLENAWRSNWCNRVSLPAIIGPWPTMMISWMAST